MANPSNNFMLKLGYFHGSSKFPTEAAQYVFESLYASGHIVRSNQVWAEDIPYCIDFAAADAWVLANPTIGKKFTLQNLTEIPGSNGQAWFIDDVGTFVRNLIAPTVVPNTTTAAPSYGFDLQLFKSDNTQITPSEGVWAYDPYSGIIIFEVGYTPADMGYGIPKVTCYQYVGKMQSDMGGGGGSITIQDEGVNVDTNVTIINFKGADVIAKPGTGRVDVYIPTPSYASHFNTTDGSTNGTVNPITTTNRNVSGPTVEGTPFKIGGWVAGSSHACINNGTLNFLTTGAIGIINNVSTTFNVRVLDADGVTVLAQNTETLIGNNVNNANNITITVTGFVVDTDQFRANLAISINLTAILPNGGRFSVAMSHIDGTDGTFTFTQNDVFYDTNSIAMAMTNPTIAETFGNVLTRRISGVEYYTTGSQFTVNVADIDNTNKDSYPAVIMDLTSTTYGMSALAVAPASLTAWTNAHDNINASYQRTDWSVSALQYCFIGNGFVSGNTKDWANGANQTNPTSPICVNTYTDNATAIYEDFRLESRRLRSDLATSWDSAASLLVADGGNGLQCRCSRLIYPQINYTTFNPNPGTQFNYSGTTGDKKANLEFHHTGIAHSNGIFTLGDHNITEGFLTSDDIVIRLSLNKTDWFILNDDYTGGTLANGSGCRANKDQHGLLGATINDSKIEFTLGTGGTTDATSGLAGFGIFVEITYKDNANGRAAYLGEIGINWV